MRRGVLAGIAAGMLAIASFAGAAAAASSVDEVHFYNCSGPNVPSAFVAVKTALPAAARNPVSGASAFRVEGSTATYTVYDFGFGAPNGISVSGVATDWCWVNYVNYGPALVRGLYHG
jgi:hypothetical protein